MEQITLTAKKDVAKIMMPSEFLFCSQANEALKADAWDRCWKEMEDYIVTAFDIPKHLIGEVGDGLPCPDTIVGD